MSVKYYDKGQNKWVIFPGTSGVPGKDAYQVAQENGYTGTKEEYNAALVNVTNIDKKQDKLISGANIKTINNESLLGEGNIETPRTLVEDNLDSINPKNALSANQGNVLKKLINTNTENINTKLSKTDAQSIYQPKGDYALNTALSQETNRAQEAEKGLQTHVTHLESEAETLKNKQTESGQKIDSINREIGAIKVDIAKETQRATVAEQTNANAIQGINSSKGSANGIATLDSTGHVPASQLPSYVDDILEFASTSAFPRPGEAGKIYIALDTNKTYRWSGSDYTVVSETLALGETSSTAYPGDKGKKNTEDILAEKNRATQAEQKLTQDLTAKVDKVAGSRLMTDAEGNQIKANKDAISGLQNGKLNKTEAESTYVTKTAVNSELSKKVDKVDGSRLMTNAEGNQIQTNKDSILTLQNNKLDKSTASTTYATKTDLNTEINRAKEAEAALGTRIDNFTEKDPLFEIWKNRAKIELGEGARAELTAVALGQRTNAGNYSVAIGQDAKATGSTSIALGNSSQATQYREISLGTYNKSYNGLHLSVADTSAQPTDRKNSFEILNNGTFRIPNLPNKEADGLGDLQLYLTELAGGGALRPLFEAIDGVKYNAQTKKYEIYKDQGGLDDVTEEQMIAIYNAGHIWNKASFADSKIRIPLRDNVVRITDSVLDFTRLFQRCANLEVVILYQFNIYSTYYNYAFFNCKELQRIVGSAINMRYIDTPSKSTGMFDGCNSLILVHIKDLKTNLSFKDSPNLSVDDYLDDTADKELSSLGYLVKYASNTSLITVTLHPTAYDKVPETLKQKATAKQIAFTKAL